MGGAEKFCLRWNDFESNVSSAFRELRDEKDFFDVTLACDDEQIHAHKVILGACSSFFRAVLRRNPHQHPLLYLKGVKYSDLESVLNFMYHGEVNVAQDDLNSFLAVAEELKVKGLTQNQNGEGSKSNSNSSGGGGSNSKVPPPRPASSASLRNDSPRSPPKVKLQPPDRGDEGGGGPSPTKRPRNAPPQLQEEDDDIQEVLPVKSEPKEMMTPTPSGSASNYDNQALVQQEDAMYAEEGYEDYGEYEEQYVDPAQPSSLQGDKGEVSFDKQEDFNGVVKSFSEYIGSGRITCCKRKLCLLS